MYYTQSINCKFFYIFLIITLKNICLSFVNNLSESKFLQIKKLYKLILGQVKDNSLLIETFPILSSLVLFRVAEETKYHTENISINRKLFFTC